MTNHISVYIEITNFNNIVDKIILVDVIYWHGDLLHEPSGVKTMSQI